MITCPEPVSKTTLNGCGFGVPTVMIPEYDVLNDTIFPCLFTGTDSRRRLIIVGWPAPGGFPFDRNPEEDTHPTNMPMKIATMKQCGDIADMEQVL